MFYENFLNSIDPNTDIIPESASFSDMSIFTNRAIQDAYNETVISLASNEMAIFEAVMLEAEVGKPDSNSDVQKALGAAENKKDDAVAQSPQAKKKVLDYIKEFFAKIWSAIKGFFANIINKIKEFFNNQKMKQLQKLIKRFDIAVEFFKVNGTEEKFGTIRSLKDSLKIFKSVYAAIGEGEKLSKNMVGKLANVKIADGASAAEDLVNREFSQEAIERAIFGNKGGATSTTVQKDTSAMFSGLEKTDVTGKNIGEYAEKIKSILNIVNGWINEIKKAYNASKKNIDSYMNQAKKLTNINTRAVRAYCNGCKRLISALNKLIGGTNSEFKKIYQEALSVAKKVISSAKRAGANIVDESFEGYGYDSFIENFVLEGDDDMDDEDVEVDSDSEEIDFNV